jgi:hypothetical protein
LNGIVEGVLLPAEVFQRSFELVGESVFEGDLACERSAVEALGLWS